MANLRDSYYDYDPDAENEDKDRREQRDEARENYEANNCEQVLEWRNS